jgi:2-amino-4-hydroxy-6-hydroxymethyldihydropteridine diphosphokinase
MSSDCTEAKGGLTFVALGSNLGDSKSLVIEAMNQLEKHSCKPLVRSSLWRGSPIDCPPGSGDFINAVVGMTPTAATPEELLTELQNIERMFGRRPKTVLNEARPLDLDLIAWDNETRRTPDLILPHPRAHMRGFVLKPLAEIAPELVLPGQQKSVRELLATRGTDERIERLD